MVYAIAEEFIRVFKSIDVDLHLGILTPVSTNHLMFKVLFCFSYKINFKI